MRIFVDAQPLASAPTGVGRYTFEVVSALSRSLCAETDQIDLGFFDFKRNAGPHLQNLVEAGKPINPCPNRLFPGRLVQAAWKYAHQPPHHWFFPSNKADLLFFPNFTIPPTRHPVCVCTIHDLSFVRHPQFAEDKNLQWLESAVPEAVLKAKAILTDSEFSRKEILEIYGPDPAKVFATPLACADIFQPMPPETVAEWLKTNGLPDTYFLSVGTMEPRKNLQILLEAFQIGCDEKLWNREASLVLTGMQGWKNQALYQQIQTHPYKSRIVETGYLPWNDLPILYSGAMAFLYPSHYEGFGMPLLEAMACGTPAVSSPRASLPEVGGDAVLYAAPNDPQAWADAMAQFANSVHARKEYGELGLRRTKLFSWEKTASEILRVFRGVLGRNP
jgi:alpha-1,3-rhamnosyl/mannosyltransferase